VIDAIEDRHLTQLKGVHPFEARHIESKLTGIRAALVMGVDAAHRAEVVFGRHGVELVEGQFVRTLYDSEAIERHTCGDGTSPAAEGAIASPWILKTVGKHDLELNRPAVAGGLVKGLRNDLHEPAR